MEKTEKVNFMALSAAAHRYVFFIAIAVIAVVLIVCTSIQSVERELHKDYYRQYEAANEQFEAGEFEESYETYGRLAEIYPGSYILQFKMGICAINMGMYNEMINHSISALRLYPKLSQEEALMDALSYAYEQLGDTESAKRISDYYFGFAANQPKYP